MPTPSLPPHRLAPPDEATRLFSRKLNSAMRQHDTHAFVRLMENTPCVQGGWWVDDIVQQLICVHHTQPMARARPPMLDAFLKSPLARMHASDMVYLALDSQNLDIIPGLHALGYRLEDPASAVFSMMQALEAGRWPHLELCYPEIFQKDGNCQRYAACIFPRPCATLPWVRTGALCVDAIERTRALDFSVAWQKFLCDAMTTVAQDADVLAIISQDPVAIEAIGHLVQIQWLDPSLVRAATPQTAAALACVFNKAQSFWQHRALHEAVELAPVGAHRRF